jgi:uncharacterized protein (DUF983 family)
VYTCPHCGESTITFWQKAWVAYIGRSAKCRRCGGSAGISAFIRYLTNAPIILLVVVLYIYLRQLSDTELRSRQTFWLLVIGILVVPTVYGILNTAFRVWRVPLIRR